MKQAQLWTREPKQPEPPKSYLELKQERERAEDDAILDRNWFADHEEEEPNELAD